MYIYAGIDARIESVMEKDGLTRSKAKDKIVKAEKQRRAYYDYYTNREWGKMSNYDLCIDADVFGEEKTVEIIAQIAKGYME